MAGVSQDWANLSESVRRLGADQFQAELGLANLALQAPKIKAETAKLNEEAAQQAIVTRDKLEREKMMNSPVTLRDAFSMFSPNDAPVQDKARMAARVPELSSIFNVKIDENNPDPNQPLMRNGKPLTRRELATEMPRYAAYIIATSDPITKMSEEMTAIKKQLGAESPGPYLDTNEQNILGQAAELTPEQQQLLSKYSKLKENYDKYSADPTSIYRQQVNVLSKLKGFVASIGGDPKIIDERTTILNNAIKEREKTSMERETMVEVTPEIAGQTGLTVGTKVSQKEIGDIAKQISASKAGIEGHNISAQATRDAANINAAAHIKGAEIAANKAAGATREASERENRARIIGDYTQTMDVRIPANVDMFIEKTMKNVAGQIINPETNQPMDINQITEFRNKLVEQERRKAQQNYYDSLGPEHWKKTFGGEPPAYIDRSPMPLRQEFSTSTNETFAAIKQIGASNKKEDQILSTQLTKLLASAGTKFKTGDPKQMENARAILSDIQLRIQQFHEQRKINLPKTIKEKTKGLTDIGNFSSIETSPSGFGLESFMGN